jgi:hypothetical protein
MFDLNLKNLSSDYFETSKEIIDELLGRKPYNSQNDYPNNINENNENVLDDGINKYLNKSSDYLKKLCHKNKNYDSKKTSIKQNDSYENQIRGTKTFHMNSILNEAIEKNKNKISLILKENSHPNMKRKVIRPKSELKKSTKNETDLKEEIENFEKSKEYEIRDQKILYMKKLYSQKLNNFFSLICLIHVLKKKKLKKNCIFR